MMTCGSRNWEESELRAAADVLYTECAGVKDRLG